MTIEAHGSSGEAIEIRRVELGTSVCAEHVSIEAVEQNDDDVLRSIGRNRRVPHAVNVR
jgi:hypothetical protein